MRAPRITAPREIVGLTVRVTGTGRVVLRVIRQVYALTSRHRPPPSLRWERTERTITSDAGVADVTEILRFLIDKGATL